MLKPIKFNNFLIDKYYLTVLKKFLYTEIYNIITLFPFARINNKPEEFNRVFFLF